MLKTTNTGMIPEMKTAYAKLITDFFPKLVHNLFADETAVIKQNGDTIEYRRLASLVADNTPLTEGVPPTSQTISVSTITDTVKQNGAVITFSEKVKKTTIDPVVETALSVLLPNQAIEVLETLTADVLSAGTNVMYAGSNTARNTVQDTDVITYNILEQATRNLQLDNVPTINGKYHAIVNPSSIYDLRQDPDWRDAYKYSNREREIYPAMLGGIGEVIFHKSTFAKVFAHQGAGTNALHTDLDGSASANQKVIPLTSTTGLSAGDLCTIREVNGYYEQHIVIDSVSAGVSITATEDLKKDYASGNTFDKGDDVMSTIVFGKGAYAVVSIDGLNKRGRSVGKIGFEVYIKNPGSAGTADPIDQIGTIGWKSNSATMILRQEALVRIEHGATSRIS